MVGEKIKRPRKSAGDWAVIRVAAEAGESVAALSRKFLVSNTSITKRAKLEGWRMPLWERKRGRAESGVPVTSESPASGLQEPENGNCNLVAIPPDILAALKNVHSAAPEDAQTALGKFAQVIALSSATSIPGPRTIQEFKIWVDLWRKLTGLDLPPAKDAGPSGLLGSMRTVTRRSARVVELPAAEPVAEPVEDVDISDV